MKVYLLRRSDELLDENNIIIVGRKSDAEKLINNNFFDYYDVIEVLSGLQIDNFFKNQLGKG